MKSGSILWSIKKTGDEMRKVIDLSKYNTVTDWNKVKAEVDGVIIRCGYRGYGSGKIVRDPKVIEFIQGCKSVGLPFGLYFMSQAINDAEGVEEADFTADIAEQYGAELPLFIDSEDGDGTARVVRADGLSKPVRTSVVKAFCNTIRNRGFVGGVYASESWYTSRLNYAELTGFKVWVAKYCKNNGAKSSTIQLSKCDMHQYTSRGTVSGIVGNVDLNEAYNIFKDEAAENGNTNTNTQEVYKVPTLKNGSEGKAVSVWQVIIGAKVDGDFGPETERLTKAYQEKNGLLVDGIVGKNSWSAGLNSL